MDNTAVKNAVNGEVNARLEYTADGIDIFDTITGQKKYHIDNIPIPIPDNDPLFNPCVAGEYGAEYWLDSTFDVLSNLRFSRDVRKLRMGIRSANSAITGNIAIVFAVNGVESELIIVPCNADNNVFEYTFPQSITGFISIIRKFESPADTLRDGMPITAIISDITLFKLMAWNQQ